MKRIFYLLFILITSTIYAQDSLYRINSFDKLKSSVGKRVCFYTPRTNNELMMFTDLHTPYVIKDATIDYTKKNPKTIIFVNKENSKKKPIEIPCINVANIPMYLSDEYEKYTKEYLNTTVTIGGNNYILKSIEWNNVIHFGEHLNTNTLMYTYESIETKRLLKTTINFKYLQDTYSLIIDNNSGLTFSKIYHTETLNKQQIFDLLQQYFTYNYGKGDHVIQIKDKEQGLIIGRGIYDNVYTLSRTEPDMRYMLKTVSHKIDYEHVLRVDCKDNKMRVIITVDAFSDNGDTFKIDLNSYPFIYQLNNNRLNKNEQNQAASLTALLSRIMRHFNSIENVLKNRSNIPADNDW